MGIFKITAQEFKWKDKICYLGLINYEDLRIIIDITEDLSMNREVNQERVKNISQYMKKNVGSIFFPPVILNSKNKINIIKDRGEIKDIEIKNKSVTIIDGQHRIYSILNVLKDDNLKEEIANFKLPFLIIENLDNNEHRKLFNLINETAANVESTVSARFKVSSENMYGLRYIRENLDKIKNGEIDKKFCFKNKIEWEKKQSTGKICYIFITEINKKILNFIKRNPNFNLDKEKYFILKTFWDKYFDFLFDNLNEKTISFYVKKVTLKAILEEILKDEDKKTITVEELKSKIEFKLEQLLIKSDDDIYKGPFNQKTEIYSDIINAILSKAEEKCIEEKGIEEKGGLDEVAIGDDKNE